MAEKIALDVAKNPEKWKYYGSEYRIYKYLGPEWLLLDTGDGGFVKKLVNKYTGVGTKKSARYFQLEDDAGLKLLCEKLIELNERLKDKNDS